MYDIVRLLRTFLKMSVNFLNLMSMSKWCYGLQLIFQAVVRPKTKGTFYRWPVIDRLRFKDAFEVIQITERRIVFRIVKHYFQAPDLRI